MSSTLGIQHLALSTQSLRDLADVGENLC